MWPALSSSSSRPTSPSPFIIVFFWLLKKKKKQIEPRSPTSGVRFGEPPPPHFSPQTLIFAPPILWSSGGDGGEGGRSDLRGRPVVANGRAQAPGRLCPLRQGRRRSGTRASPPVSVSAHARPPVVLRDLSVSCCPRYDMLGTMAGRAVVEVERWICRLLLRSVERGCVFCVGRRIAVSTHFYAFCYSERGVTW